MVYEQGNPLQVCIIMADTTKQTPICGSFLAVFVYEDDIVVGQAFGTVLPCVIPLAIFFL